MSIYLFTKRIIHTNLITILPKIMSGCKYRRKLRIIVWIFTHCLDYHIFLASFNTNFFSTAYFWNALIVLIKGFLYLKAATYFWQRKLWRQDVRSSASHCDSTAMTTQVMATAHQWRRRLWQQHINGDAGYGDNTPMATQAMATAHQWRRTVWNFTYLAYKVVKSQFCNVLKICFLSYFWKTWILF